ncbi:hypothetical protein GE09DRAFT_1151510 [Coniochaeta sp. 2T2.1]|nr:hypothetical protein GE09DRAFT_1151510 [Coniochaeta sp. 2T2.1]
MTEPIRPVSKRDRTNENFLRAAKRIMRRGDEMHRRYGAEVYIVMRRKGRYYDYCSTQDHSFPPSCAEINKTYPLPIRRTPAHFDLRTKGSSKEIITEGQSSTT